MRLKGSGILGLMLGEHGIICAHVTSTGSERVVKSVGRFPFMGSLLDRPEEVGKALREFLDKHKFNASRAIFGVPARWVIAQERDIPPTDEAQARSILRMQAERLSVAESGTVVADYAGSLKGGNPRVMLVGMLRTQIEKIQKLADAAELSIVAICPTTLAASAVMGTDHAMLCLSPDGAEYIQWQAGGPRLIRPISGGADPSAIGTELRRTLAMRSGNTDELLVCDGIGLDAGVTSQLLTRIGSSARSLDAEKGLSVKLDPSVMNGAAIGMRANAHLPAVALALAGLNHRVLPVNFIDPKLAPEKQSRLGRQSIYAIVAAAGLVLAIIILWFTAQSRESEAAELARMLKEKEPAITDAKQTIARLKYGRTYFTDRPPLLDCLRQLTLMYNYEEPIWVTNITLKDNGQGTLQGKSTNDQLNLKLSDRIKADKNFSTALLMESREAGGRGGEFTYTITFKYSPVPGAELPNVESSSAGARTGNRRSNQR